MRAAALAVRVSESAGLSEQVAREAFYAALLRHVGCVGYAHELAALFGDDLQANAAGSRTNFASRVDVVTSLVPGVTRGFPLADRARMAVSLVGRGAAVAAAYESSTCEVGRAVARRMGLPEGVQRALFEVYEWWNGKGHPAGLAGVEIAEGARVARLASDVAVLHGIGGVESAVAAAQDRAGTILDPRLVEALRRNCDVLLGGLATADPRQLALAAEPRPWDDLPAHGALAVAEAMADLVDLKSPYLHGHSREVARIASASGAASGLDRGSQQTLRLAGLLHDLGRVAVSNRVWEKRGPLTSVEWDQVRLHTYHAERMLADCATFADAAPLVARHHERLDGSGYHRAERGRSLSAEVRVLAAADAFQAMTQPRPHRGPLPPTEAADELAAQARMGVLDADAVRAVLSTAGDGRARRITRPLPAGLTEREVEVVVQLAQGLSNAEIGQALGVSRRTAEHHLQHAYTKIGVSSRAAVTIFALEHDLLAPRPD